MRVVLIGLVIDFIHAAWGWHKLRSTILAARV
jgi:hypothetical protein